MTFNKPPDELERAFTDEFEKSENCPSSTELCRFLLGELTGHDCQRIEFHLLNCEHCVHFVERKRDSAAGLSWSDHRWIMDSRHGLRAELGLPENDGSKSTSTVLSFFKLFHARIRIPIGYTLIGISVAVLVAFLLPVQAPKVEYFGQPEFISSLDLYQTRSLDDVNFEAELIAGQLITIIDYAPHEKVVVTLHDDRGRLLFEGSIPTIDRQISVPLRFNLPGTFNLSIHQVDDKSPFVSYQLVVLPEGSSSR